MHKEYWSCDAGNDSVAVLNVPAALGRHRVFDIDITLIVQVPGEAGAWHELDVEIDGRQRWRRRVSSHSPADNLDYHCRMTVEPGHGLSVRAKAAVMGSRVQRLHLEAREEA